MHLPGHHLDYRSLSEAHILHSPLFYLTSLDSEPKRLHLSLHLYHYSMQNTAQPMEIPTNPAIWLASHNAALTSTTMHGHTVAEHLDLAAWYES